MKNQRVFVRFSWLSINTHINNVHYFFILITVLSIVNHMNKHFLKRLSHDLYQETDCKMNYWDHHSSLPYICSSYNRSSNIFDPETLSIIIRYLIIYVNKRMRLQSFLLWHLWNQYFDLVLNKVFASFNLEKPLV